MRASEDNPAGKKPEAQQPPPAASTGPQQIPQVDPRDNDIVRSYSNPLPQQQVAAATTLAQTVNPAKYPPTQEQTARYNNSVRYVPQQEKGLFGGHLRGLFDYGRDRPKTDRTDGSFEAGFYSNPGVQDQLEEEELRDRRIQPPETGEQPKAKLPAVDEKKENGNVPVRNIPGVNIPYRLH